MVFSATSLAPPRCANAIGASHSRYGWGRGAAGICPSIVAAMSATITVRAPYDDEVIGEIPAMTADDVDRAVAAATRALHDNPLPLWKRADILDKAALRLTE